MPLYLAGARQTDFLRRARRTHHGLRAVLGVADVEWLLCFLLRDALALRVGLRTLLRFLLESRFHRRALLGRYFVLPFLRHRRNAADLVRRVISHSPGLTSSLSAASASGATHQQPSRTIRVHRVFIERLPVRRSWAGLWRKSSRNAAPARRVPLRGYPQAFHLPPQARFHQDCRAERHAAGEALEAAALRDPEACRAPAALRPAPGARRRLQILGRDARPFARRRKTSDSQSKWKTIRSTTAISKARSRRASTAAAPCSCGTAASGSRSATCRREAQLRKGELKFVFAGERLQGSWVLVRMKSDREGGKRTNWLLIKHRDEFARDADGDAENDRRGRLGRLRAHDERDRGRQGPRAQAVHAQVTRKRAPMRLASTRRSREPERKSQAAKPSRR